MNNTIRFITKAGKILLSCSVIAFMLIGCELVLLEKPAVSESNVTITVSTAARAITPPGGIENLLERIDIEFTKQEASQEISQKLTLDKGHLTGNVLLEAGFWSINAIAYVKIGDTEYEAAKGTANVTVVAGETHRVPIVLQTGILEDAPGVFTYNFVFPAELTIESFELELHSFFGEDTFLSYWTIDVDTIINGSEEMPPDFYMLTVTVEDSEEKVAIWNNIVHIYSGQETTVTHIFNADEFFASTPPIPPIGGNLGEFTHFNSNDPLRQRGWSLSSVQRQAIINGDFTHLELLLDMDKIVHGIGGLQVILNGPNTGGYSTDSFWWSDDGWLSKDEISNPLIFNLTEHIGFDGFISGLDQWGQIVLGYYSTNLDDLPLVEANLVGYEILELGDFTAFGDDGPTGNIRGWMSDGSWENFARTNAKYLIIETKGSYNRNGFGAISIYLSGDINPDWTETQMFNDGWISFPNEIDDTVYIVIEMNKLNGYESFANSNVWVNLLVGHWPNFDNLGFQTAYLTDMDMSELQKDEDTVPFDYGFIIIGSEDSGVPSNQIAGNLGNFDWYAPNHGAWFINHSGELRIGIISGVLTHLELMIDLDKIEDGIGGIEVILTNDKYEWISDTFFGDWLDKDDIELPLVYDLTKHPGYNDFVNSLDINSFAEIILGYYYSPRIDALHITEANLVSYGPPRKDTTVRTAFDVSWNMWIDYPGTIRRGDPVRLEAWVGSSHLYSTIEYNWNINGVRVGTGRDITIPSNGFSVGRQEGLAVIILDGTAFSRTFRFWVY